MNDEPSTRAAPRHDHHIDTHETLVEAVVDEEEASASGSRVNLEDVNHRRSRPQRRRRKRDPGLLKKLHYITDLLNSLDLLVFAELSSLYYMECSMFRFILRAIGQYMYLTPKDEAFPFSMPPSCSQVALIICSNLICISLHMFGSVPTGYDHHRGYQHGGIVVDFIGQKPATHKSYYVVADLLILLIQCLMLSIHAEREKLRVALKTFRPLLPEVAADAANEQTLETLDAEERGVPSIQSSAGHAGSDAGTEAYLTRDQVNSEGGTGRDESSPPSPPLDAEEEDRPRTHLSDIMDSGNAVLGEYCPTHTIRTAAMDFERTTAHSLQTISYGVTMATLQARQGGTTARPPS